MDHDLTVNRETLRQWIAARGCGSRYLDEEFLAEWNRRFACKPVEAADAHRPLRSDQNPASILGASAIECC